jgi:hypothetical protein
MDHKITSAGEYSCREVCFSRSENKKMLAGAEYQRRSLGFFILFQRIEFGR